MTEVSTQPELDATGGGHDFEAPPFRRLRYFHGQLLSARDFQREQEYFREKLKLRMRCLLGYGVVCGLLVEPVADNDKDASPTGDASPPTKAKVRITSGLGVDCEGNEIVVRNGCVINLWDALKAEERDTRTVWIGLEYREQAVEPTRTVFNSSCADTSDCEFGWTEESYCVRVTSHKPPRDRRCDTCCGRCEHRIVWLARIDDIDWQQPLTADQIHMNIRRPFGKRVPTVITGVNWIHGHTYTVDEAKELLGTHDESGGLVLHFSDDVRVDTLKPGVVDIQVIEGGAGRNADTWYMGGKFEEPGDTTDEFTQHFRYRQTTRETLQDGDRVLVTVRAAFILDRCCRPVDGTNVGGKVPFTGDLSDTPPPSGCVLPPSGVGPWTSGTGAGGDVFESWFFITEESR